MALQGRHLWFTICGKVLIKVPEPSSGPAKTSDFDPGGYTSLSLHGGGTSRRLRERYPESDPIPYTEVKTSRKDTKLGGIKAAISPCGGEARILARVRVEARVTQRQNGVVLEGFSLSSGHQPPSSAWRRCLPPSAVVCRPPSAAVPENMQRSGLVRGIFPDSIFGFGYLYPQLWLTVWPRRGRVEVAAVWVVAVARAFVASLFEFRGS
ncbi:hypothetical protein V6N13_040987 [Hibiscus sabdariffa]